MSWVSACLPKEGWTFIIFSLKTIFLDFFLGFFNQKSVCVCVCVRVCVCACVSKEGWRCTNPLLVRHWWYLCGRVRAPFVLGRGPCGVRVLTSIFTSVSACFLSRGDWTVRHKYGYWVHLLARTNDISIDTFGLRCGRTLLIPVRPLGTFLHDIAHIKRAAVMWRIISPGVSRLGFTRWVPGSCLPHPRMAWVRN